MLHIITLSNSLLSHIFDNYYITVISLQGLINTCKFEGMGLYFWQGHVNDLEPFQVGFTS